MNAADPNQLGRIVAIAVANGIYQSLLQSELQQLPMFHRRWLQQQLNQRLKRKRGRGNELKPAATFRQAQEHLHATPVPEF